MALFLPSGGASRLRLAQGLLFIATLALAQDVHPVSGRQIAPVMGAAGADWLERSEREREENPEAALDALGLRAGMAVADIGAGTGYMTLRIARRVGPTGKVYGEDIQPEMLRRLRANALRAKLTNIDAAPTPTKRHRGGGAVFSSRHSDSSGAGTDIDSEGTLRATRKLLNLFQKWTAPPPGRAPPS